jgi:histidinol phosphatase-like PHP family hydrolase
MSESISRELPHSRRCSRRSLAPSALGKTLRGDLQMHTHHSDGADSVADMAEQAEARGYEFIAITDHSKELSIANGMDEKWLRKQGIEIAEVNRALAERGSKLRVLKAIEMNLNPEGEGDMESDALAELDLVLGSFHSALRRKRIKPPATSQHCAIRIYRFSVIRVDAFTTIARV